MASPFRKNAVQARANSGESRTRTSLVTPRRALVALAVIAMLVAGLLYVAVSSLTTPVAGIGWADRGGFVTMTAPVAGKVSDDLSTGTRLRKGEKFGELTTPAGETTALTAPEDSIVMKRGSLTSTFVVKEGDPIVTLGLITEPAILYFLLPGVQATGFARGDLSEGAKVWVRTATGESFTCTVIGYNAYEQSGAAVVAYIPSPSVERFVQANGSVVFGGARCPQETLDAQLVGAVVPVSVEVGRRSLLSYIFGGS
jgi:hypothetical protein